jgi:8-oxo-dGTP pyrophosphatase MutT (NUDIX family)
MPTWKTKRTSLGPTTPPLHLVVTPLPYGTTAQSIAAALGVPATCVARIAEAKKSGHLYATVDVTPSEYPHAFKTAFARMRLNPGADGGDTDEPAAALDGTDAPLANVIVGFQRPGCGHVPPPALLEAVAAASRTYVYYMAGAPLRYWLDLRVTEIAADGGGTAVCQRVEVPAWAIADNFAPPFGATGFAHLPAAVVFRVATMWRRRRAHANVWVRVVRAAASAADSAADSAVVAVFPLAISGRHFDALRLKHCAHHTPVMSAEEFAALPLAAVTSFPSVAEFSAVDAATGATFRFYDTVLTVDVVPATRLSARPLARHSVEPELAALLGEGGRAAPLAKVWAGVCVTRVDPATAAVEWLLVQERYHGSGAWGNPGGGLAFFNGFAAAACAELLEETGYRVVPAALTPVAFHRFARGRDVRAGAPPVVQCGVLYHVRIPADAAPAAAARDSLAVAWVPWRGCRCRPSSRPSPWRRQARASCRRSAAWPMARSSATRGSCGTTLTRCSPLTCCDAQVPTN